jgi:uncharacterized protein
MICVYHAIDLDGWCSAAIVKNLFPDCELVGYNHSQPLPDLSRHDKVIMCDISFKPEQMVTLALNLGFEKFIWIDHHISSINDMKYAADWINYGHGEVHEPIGLRDTKFSACELTWKYFHPNEKMPEGVRLLGRYDCFGHKGTEEELAVLLFQFAARARWKDPQTTLQALYLTSGQVAQMITDGNTIYQYLLTEAKQSYDNGFVMDFDGLKFIAVNKERFNPINFGIDYHREGYDGAACFHYAHGNWNFSLYNDNGKVDCSAICKKRGGGGHAGAAGFVTKNINDYVPNEHA